MDLELTDLGRQRLSLAQELHDVVGHGMTVIHVHAGVALSAIDDDPRQAAASIALIKTVSRTALLELRDALATLRQPVPAAPSRPAAGLDRLRALVVDLARGGLAVELDVLGERPLPGGIEAAAYRIVQESLTNVLRHAPLAAARVTVRYGPAELVLEIVDDGAGSARRPAPGDLGRGGLGIVGMRERAAELGGTLEAGPRPGGGFRVLARLPMSVPVI